MTSLLRKFATNTHPKINNIARRYTTHHPNNTVKRHIPYYPKYDTWDYMALGCFSFQVLLMYKSLPATRGAHYTEVC